MHQEASEHIGQSEQFCFWSRLCVFLRLQLGTLGAGNHYAEIQVVDEIYNDYAAKKMGIDHQGQVCVMIHSGSRGLGHQVATGKQAYTPEEGAAGSPPVPPPPG